MWRLPRNFANNPKRGQETGPVSCPLSVYRILFVLGLLCLRALGLGGEFGDIALLRRYRDLHLYRRILRLAGSRFQLADALVVGLNGGLGGSDALAGGGIGPAGYCAVLGVVQLAQLYVGLLDGILLTHVGSFQLGDLRQLHGFRNPGLDQIRRFALQFVKKCHSANLLKTTVSRVLALF